MNQSTLLWKTALYFRAKQLEKIKKLSLVGRNNINLTPVEPVIENR